MDPKKTREERVEKVRDRHVALPLVSILGIVALALLVQETVLSDPDKLQTWMQSHGPYAFLVYLPIQALTIIIAPIGGYTPQLVMYAIFGPLWGALLVYLTVTPAYMINFYLAKRYGEQVLRRVLGDKATTRTLRYVTLLNTPLLAFLRMQPALFDYISYSAGLTSITYTKFFLINGAAGLVTIPVTYSVFRYSHNFVTGVIIHVGLSAAAVLLFLWYSKNRHQQRTQ